MTDASGQRPDLPLALALRVEPLRAAGRPADRPGRHAGSDRGRPTRRPPAAGGGDRRCSRSPAAWRWWRSSPAGRRRGATACSAPMRCRCSATTGWSGWRPAPARRELPPQLDWAPPAVDAVVARVPPSAGVWLEDKGLSATSTTATRRIRGRPATAAGRSSATSSGDGAGGPQRPHVAGAATCRRRRQGHGPRRSWWPGTRCAACWCSATTSPTWTCSVRRPTRAPPAADGRHPGGRRRRRGAADGRRRRRRRAS